MGAGLGLELNRLIAAKVSKDFGELAILFAARLIQGFQTVKLSFLI